LGSVAAAKPSLPFQASQFLVSFIRPNAILYTTEKVLFIYGLTQNRDNNSRRVPV
jgi:hypothetical protein